MSSMDDEQIVRKLRSGDATAIREARAAMFDKYEQGLLAYVSNRFWKIQTREDIVQETFIAAWKNIDQLREPSKLRPWLYAIASRLGIAAGKERGGVGPPDEDLPAPGRTPDEEAQTAVGIAILRRAVQSLSKHLQQTFWLLSQGFDGQDLADVMAINRTYAYKLKERLRKELPPAQATLRLALYGSELCPKLAGMLRESGWGGSSPRASAER